ncbi:MAG TPA: DUF6298 domain-containing protein, partial [Candidatus Angelobacter sp.]|nr:DUF6298 domain-containing protein [Candidatus Angelobacter sp.]
MSRPNNVFGLGERMTQIKHPFLFPRLITLLAVLNIAGAVSLHAAPKKISAIISVGKDGRLVYGLDEKGNRVPDFSTCGYAGGGQPIPEVEVRVVVAPVPGDETARIQKALDYVGALPADTNGFRGAVLLLKGRHEVSGALQITNSGVVLRGQGMSEEGTILVATGTDRRTLIRITGQNDLSAHGNAGWKIADDYVPVGATSFHLISTEGLGVGDTIQVVRPSTREWINALGLNEFGGGLGDWRLVWHPGSYDLVWDRVIEKIDGTLVTLDSPTTTAMDKEFGGGYVKLYAWPDRIRENGVENLRLESGFDPQNSQDENHSWFGISMENTDDSWVRQVTFAHFAGSAVAVYESCKRVTVEDCLSLAPVSENGGWRRDTFYTMGQQTLFLCCYAENGRHDFSVGHCAAGPNAFVQCEDTLPQADSGGMGAWASGTLFDNVRIDGGGLSLGNRGADGEGAGWAGVNSVLWQCDASKIACENPPGAQNWAFGCWGEFAGNGLWRDVNASVKPISLFVAQVSDRLGKSAAEGYSLMPRSFTEYSNPTAKQAAESIAESLKPAPQLADFIASSARQNPISGDLTHAIQIEDVTDRPAGAPPAMQILSVTNGWLVMGDKLLIGSVEPINWWRGNMRPSEAKDYGVNLTR